MTWETSRRDVRLLFSTRIIRLFCYGFLSVVLALYLAAAGLREQQIGLLFTLTLAGDAGISLWLTTTADRFGRKRTLIAGALLMFGAGAVFVMTRQTVLLMAAAIIGVISPSGNEVGPFLPIEQAALSQIVPGDRRTAVFAWYTLAGSFATAAGSLAGGALSQTLQHAAVTPVGSFRAVVVLYAALGLLLLGCFARVSPAVELRASGTGGPARHFWGIGRSRGIVARLSALFALDS